MLPVYLSQEISYAYEGVFSAAPMYTRILVALDAEALISGSNPAPDWNTLEPRKALMSQLQNAFANDVLKGCSIAAVPFCLPPTPTPRASGRGCSSTWGHPLLLSIPLA